MSESPISPAQANLKLAIMQADADAVSSSDLYINLQQLGLPSELTMRLYELSKQTKKIGNQVVNVGKIIVAKLVEFVKAHPNLFIGAALGAAIGVLVNSIPFLGPLLSPLVTLIAVAFGSAVGHRMDKGKMGTEVGVVELTEDIIEIARDFFQFLIDVLTTVSQSELSLGL